jgi:hypothetical protein
VKKQVQVKIEDTGGKTWTLTGTDEGVKIEAPVSLRTRPIPLAELRRALDELEGRAP